MWLRRQVLGSRALDHGLAVELKGLQQGKRAWPRVSQLVETPVHDTPATRNQAAHRGCEGEVIMKLTICELYASLAAMSSAFELPDGVDHIAPLRIRDTSTKLSTTLNQSCSLDPLGGRAESTGAESPKRHTEHYHKTTKTPTNRTSRRTTSSQHTPLRGALSRNGSNCPQWHHVRSPTTPMAF